MAHTTLTIPAAQYADYDDCLAAAAYDIAIGADLARTEPERSADSLEAALGDIEKRAQHAGGLARKALGREP